MTIRTVLLLFGIGCVLLASAIFFRFDLPVVRNPDVREDVHGWAWLGVACIAASWLPWRGHWFGKGPAR